MKESGVSSKKHEVFNSFSREYHYCLSFSWKVRKGLSNNIPFVRIKRYCDWFFDNYLNRLINDEEEFLLPLLPEEGVLVKKVRAEHRRFRRLFAEKKDLEKALNHIEEELDRSIRFKERTLFSAIEKVASVEKLNQILALRDEMIFIENSADEFWK